jgi:hypothetical protein
VREEICRGRGAPGRSRLGAAFDGADFEPAHFAMERRMMIGLKQLAERGSRHRWSNHLQGVLWTITFGLWVVAAVLVFRRPAWLRPLAGFVAAGVVFQLLSLVQPPAPIGALLVAALALLLNAPRLRAA